MSDYLDKYIHDWKLENVEKLTSTFTSDVYTVESAREKRVLKILNEVGIKDELPGTYFLQACKGIGAVELFKYDERALLIEYLPGENLYQFSKSGREAEASKVFCAIIKKVKKNIPHIDRFQKVDDLCSIFDQIEAPRELGDLLEIGKSKFEELRKTQTEEVLLHGDLHHENVISRKSGEFVCFDPKGLLGDPAYELGTTLKNPWDYPKISHDIDIFRERAKYFSKELGLPYDRVVGYAFVHLCLSIAWAIEDGVSFEHQLALAIRCQVEFGGK